MEQEATLRVLINQIDYTVASPGALDNTSLPRVPVIRIYGASSKGKKACVHVHQVYPYFFVEYGGKLSPDNVNQYIAKLSRSLNHAIAISMKRNPHSRNSQFVRGVILVKGVHFYGFHSSYTPFLKILIADPAFVNRAVTILQSGTVMRTRFRVYESHLSYILQFMCDFGLYGCGWINLAEVWQRGHEENDIEMMEPSMFDVSSYFRQSRMPLEVDVAAHQILNRRLLSARNIHHTLEIPSPPLPSEPFVLSVRELWDDERRRRLAKGLPPTPVLPIDSSKMSRGRGNEWVAEARWWEELRKRIEKERDPEPTFTGGAELWEKWVMTTFESVEALWEAEWRTWKPARKEATGHNGQSAHGLEAEDQENPFAQATQDGSSINRKGPPQSTDVDVDEMLLSTQEMSQMMDREDQEWADLQAGDSIAEPDAAADDPLTEDGPPPDFGIDAPSPSGEVEDPTGTDGDESRLSSPSPGLCRTNSFRHLWHNLAIRKRARSLSASSDLPATPTKRTRYTSHEAAHHATTPIMNALPSIVSTKPLTQRESSPDLSDSSDNSAGRDFEENLFQPRDEQSIDVSGTPKSLQDSMSHQVESSVLRTNAVVGDLRRHNSVQRNESSLQLTLPRASFSSHVPPTSSPTTAFTFVVPPPSSSELFRTIETYGVPRRVYRDPYYSKRADAPEHPREYAGLLYHLKGGEGLDTLDHWKSHGSQFHTGRAVRPVKGTYMSWGWEYAALPPSKTRVIKWLKENPARLTAKAKMHSQIEGGTQMNPYGVKSMPHVRSDSNTRVAQHMSLFSLEVFAPSQGNKVPDANVDGIVAIFFALGDDDIHSVFHERGILAVKNAQLDPRRIRGFPLEIVADELELLNRIVDIVVEFDPDIIVGWDVQSASWGYLNARGNHYGFDIGELISRAPSKDPAARNDLWSQRTTTTFKVTGRHVFNVWRIMRVEQTLSIYSFENVAFQLLRRRVPRYIPEVLTTWYNSTDPVHTSRVLRYFLERTIMTLEILQEAETTTKNAEFARVFGVDFYSVISRGSQFKVESFMFRIAKPESFVLLSPSKQDVGKQNAAECMPLIMEPLSAFYNGPLVVLDFQSLYPSIMIAYNYCYSTCLGRIMDFQGRNKFGVVDLQRPRGLLEKLQDHITVAPNGIMYVKPEVRKGLLSRMLTELLDTRVMVKQAMKVSKTDEALSRVLDARQLSLKYIANVTYGYTSATYSGRMPAVEIADSIVQSGRETLEKAIEVIDSTSKWGARVVYGDTDSLFIYLQGKTKEQAFHIGYDIADTVTAMNPAPIKLKFEKVYLPCVLMAKKRYVGFKFENPDETAPAFDAKGIETVRRDGVPAQSKMTETCLKILFRTQDLSQVKDYCYESWTKILQNQASIQDFVFAKEVKMGTYSEKAPPPPGVAVAARRMMEDENDEVQYGDRIPYVIIRGEPQTRLVDRAVSPEKLLQNKHMQLDASYYISRVLIPPLERVFNLVGADVRAWFDDMPKAIRVNHPNPLAMSPKKQRITATRFKIDEHFQSSQCLACGGLSSDGICEICRRTPQETMPTLLEQIRKGEARLLDAHRVCASCASTANAEPNECINIDCPWLFDRKKAERRTEFLEGLEGIMEDLEILEDHYEGTPD
ncbi:hypothetical protein DEU56DRAFT_770809 [Suillus clintonianus]|uniref:uncharacterized protein n=1 Tax=Suillus clintonianus TaxID=1904413 RepID=UPI001B87CB7F|nr:uncharacterized protein DEU56DRAFT_770809 [Suillus clintonianus]KAG2154856.1 hypothetical protein DEU56DRAFT_770809 [Suillus clintonianus]